MVVDSSNQIKNSSIFIMEKYQLYVKKCTYFFLFLGIQEWEATVDLFSWTSIDF